MQTSPYHPQTSDVVERMHGTFKSILRKCSASSLDWVGQINTFYLYLGSGHVRTQGSALLTLCTGFGYGSHLRHCTIDCMRWKVKSWECMIV